MQRRRDEGRKVIVLTPPPETLKLLEELTALTGGTIKGEAEMIVRRGVKTALQEARAMVAEMTDVAREAQKYLPYARFLKQPGASFRVKDRELRASNWHPLAEKLGVFYAKVERSGWSRKRADRFLKQIAKSTAPGVNSSKPESSG